MGFLRLYSAMAVSFEHLSPQHRDFITQQRMFFVATAPRNDDGHINISPKGLDGTFRVLDERTVAYLDLTGSGIETIAHLKQNGRICVMFCAFEGSPDILRIHGRGEVLEADTPRFESLRPDFPDLPAVRSIILVHIDRVSTSCGWGVPLMAYQGQRDNFVQWSTRKGEDGIRDFQQKHNTQSIDGLPGLPPSRD